MAESKTSGVDRRGFLKGAASAAALVVTPAVVEAQTAPTQGAAPASQAQIASDTNPPAPRAAVYTVDRPGSDFMVDVIKSLNFEYVAANPGSSFRGLHESIINYGGNASPELLTCCHEESSVATAHGYAKIEGKPRRVRAHGTVGLQHASVAIDNPTADGVPRQLVAAEHPVIVAGRVARTPDGVRLLVELAETLHAPVHDRPFRFRMNFPTRHPLYDVGAIADGDVVLGLEVADFWQATHAQTP